jgi:L-alanine-DL-glutamate epimerase-like enolase superfamily enzyme
MAIRQMSDNLILKQTMTHNIRIQQASSGFEREKLIRPFGLKGGSLTELWQSVVQLVSENGYQSTGLGTQSVLYGDADLFATLPEVEANRLMYELTVHGLELVRQTPFSSPPELLEKILPALLEQGRQRTLKPDLHPNFVLNALIPIDHAAWLIYAAEHGMNNFEKMLPAEYQSVLAARHERIAIMFQVPYGMPVQEVQQAVQEGYFIIKIKLGQAGTESEMLQKDKNRISDIHRALQNHGTDLTANGKLLYTLDANGRYAQKESIRQLLDHTDEIGMREQILLFEEPLQEANDAYVGDLGVRMAADESLHDARYALRRIEQGYEAFVLKSVAKTLSLTLSIAKIAAEQRVPCICADLTVNPILLSWHQNMAARLPSFPGLENIGIMETNGKENYRNWERMLSYHPIPDAPWLKPQGGVFSLNETFYQQSGGIFFSSLHYEAIVKH